jgi:DNA-binding CsgD family transcriptional regulator
MIGPLFLRDSTSGRGLVRQAVEDQRARAAVGTLPHLLFHIARDGAASDHWAGAAADYTEAIDLARELGQTTELAVSLSGLAWLEARAGEEEACRAHAAEALTISAAHRNNLGTAWSTYALGDLELSLGDADRAVARFEQLTAFLDEIGFADVDLSPAPELVEALLRLGRIEEALSLAASYADRAHAKGAPWAAARAHRLQGMVDASDRIDEHFRTALDLHAQTLDVYERARTQLLYGARLRRARRRVDARVQLRESVETFDRLGARRWADTAADELAATGETARRGGSDSLSLLTPRERQISRLLAEGQTTREAAAALFVSPKTVEYHLRNVYVKLAINSRAELAQVLARIPV